MRNPRAARPRETENVGGRQIFPTESLLDHVPALILEIGAYLRRPKEGAIAANTAILNKAQIEQFNPPKQYYLALGDSAGISRSF